MNRRETLKHLGFGSFYVFSSSVLFASLNSCDRNVDNTWQPDFFRMEDIADLTKICEAIMPMTDSPGATDANVVQHLDQSIYLMDSEIEKAYMRDGLKVFQNAFSVNMNTDLSDASMTEVTKGINGYLRAMRQNPGLLQRYFEDLSKFEPKEAEFYEIHFVYTIVNATIWSFLTSELIGKSVMRYNPVPGKYEGFYPIKGDEKAWSFL